MASRLTQVGLDTGQPIEFSLSHSGQYAVVAVANGRAVGVDIEVCRPDVDALKLAQRFFAPGESQRIAQAHGEEQPRMFYRYWTGKEAYLKGRGVGLSFGLDRFELLFDDQVMQAQVRLTDSGTSRRDWSVHTLQLGEHRRRGDRGRRRRLDRCKCSMRRRCFVKRSPAV